MNEEPLRVGVSIHSKAFRELRNIFPQALWYWYGSPEDLLRWATSDGLDVLLLAEEIMLEHPDLCNYVISLRGWCSVAVLNEGQKVEAEKRPTFDRGRVQFVSIDDLGDYLTRQLWLAKIHRIRRLFLRTAGAFAQKGNDWRE